MSMTSTLRERRLFSADLIIWSTGAMWTLVPGPPCRDARERFPHDPLVPPLHVAVRRVQVVCRRRVTATAKRIPPGPAWSSRAKPTVETVNPVFPRGRFPGSRRRRRGRGDGPCETPGASPAAARPAVNPSLPGTPLRVASNPSHASLPCHYRYFPGLDGFGFPTYVPGVVERALITSSSLPPSASRTVTVWADICDIQLRDTPAQRPDGRHGPCRRFPSGDSGWAGRTRSPRRRMAAGGEQGKRRESRMEDGPVGAHVRS